MFQGVEVFDVLSSCGWLLRQNTHLAHTVWVLNAVDVIISQGDLVIMPDDRYKWFANGISVVVLDIYIYIYICMRVCVCCENPKYGLIMDQE